MPYTPNELKALVLKFGGFKNAASKLKISETSLRNAAKADFTGSMIQLSSQSNEQINKHLKRLSPKTKKEIKTWEKMLNQNEKHAEVNKALMKASPAELKWARDNWQKYKNKLSEYTLWTKIMGRLYGRHGWKRGHFSK